jgi:8-oxo-dGTP pyrophosphatase MutT (NUDIX family)
MYNSIKQINSIQCCNCGCNGHTSKQCIHPITSYGVILFRVKHGSAPSEPAEDDTWNQAKALLTPNATPSGIENLHSSLEFLLIQRRDSIGFIELMRGKYKINDIEYIRKHLEGMTLQEHQKLLYTPFDELWVSLWGYPKEGTHLYKNEKELARMKLESLRSGSPSLETLIAELKAPFWDTPEWGFQKGRRDPHETEFACAMREMLEETSISQKDIHMIRNLEPLSETFFGTNGVQYCHKYFLVYMPKNKPITVDMQNEDMAREVGGIEWMTMEQACLRIRPDNIEKKEVLLRAGSLLRNYCPLILKPFDMNAENTPVCKIDSYE